MRCLLALFVTPEYDDSLGNGERYVEAGFLEFSVEDPSEKESAKQFEWPCGDGFRSAPKTLQE